MSNILVADDIEEIRFAYKAVLCAAGHNVITARNGNEAAKLLSQNEIDLIVTDLMMPDGDGIQLATCAHGLENRPKLLVITGGGSRISAPEALKMSEYFFDASLIKPVSQDVLLNAVNSLLNKQITTH